MYRTVVVGAWTLLPQLHVTIDEGRGSDLSDLLDLYFRIILDNLCRW